MPLKPTELLISKLNTLFCMLYISEGIFAVIPLTLYGLMTRCNLLFYIWEIIILIIFPIFIAIVISTILLILMRLAKFLKNKNIYQYIITIIFIIVFCILELKLFNISFNVQNDNQAIEQLNSISTRLEEAGKYFLIINPSIKILLNPTKLESFFEIFKLLFINLIFGSVFIFIGKKIYLKDLLKNRIDFIKRKRKKINIEKKIRNNNKAKSYIKKEIKLLIREPVFFMQCVFPVLIIIIICVLLVVALLPAISKSMQDDSVKELISKLSFNQEAICDILIIIQVLFSLSTISLTAISREGKNALFIKNIPVELYKQFIYKNIPQILLNLIVSFVAIGVVWYLIPNINILYLILIEVTTIFINLINCYLMLIVDLRRPNLDWDTEYSVVKKSDNKIFQYVFMIINILFLMYIARIFKNSDILVYLIAQLIIFAIIFIVIDRCVKKFQNKLFNKIF